MPLQIITNQNTVFSPTILLNHSTYTLQYYQIIHSIYKIIPSISFTCNTRHFDYCPSASECDNQSVRSSAPVVSRCFPGGYNVKLYISRGRLAWWLLAFLHSVFFTFSYFITKNTNNYLNSTTCVILKTHLIDSVLLFLLFLCIKILMV